MTAKQLLPNQCMPLHFLYGRDDCCLCNERRKVAELEARIRELENPTIKVNCDLPEDAYAIDPHYYQLNP